MNVLLRAAAAIRVARGEGATLERRRKYATDWHAYIRDVFGHKLSQQQSDVVEHCYRCHRVLIPAAQNVGKTFVLALCALCLFDPVAALPGPEGQPQQGARILLPGPDADTVFETIYTKIISHALRAQMRGWRMPGTWSEKSVLWRVDGYPEWTMEALTPPKRIGEAQAHGAAGRHHVNQHALIEEGNGVEEALWTTVERMCSATGNKIISPYNPTESVGPAIAREATGTYRVIRLSALDHPNVQQRATVVPGAISHKEIDELVRVYTRDQGPFPGTALDTQAGDFVYALPPAGAKEDAPRKDKIPGHKSGKPRVRRPQPTAEVSILGRTSSAGESGLFDPAAWDAAVARGAKAEPPSGAPDRVGIDCAREGDDDSCGAPAWGEDAEALLLAYAAAQTEGPAALATLLKTRRAQVGSLVVVPKGDGPAVAEAFVRHFPSSPWNVDESSVGASVLDHAARVMGIDAHGISFSAAAPDPTPGEPWSENLRTAMYVRAARLTKLGLVDPPDDPQLRQELMVHYLLHRARSVEVEGRKERKPSVLLIDKDTVKRRIGRSPDKADAFVLCLVPLPAVQLVGEVLGISTPGGSYWRR
jgi:hypothetical protein